MSQATELYREARFSVHPLEESHRDRALADLEALHADLARVASRRAAASSLTAPGPGVGGGVGDLGGAEPR